MNIDNYLTDFPKELHPEQDILNALNDVGAQYVSRPNQLAPGWILWDEDKIIQIDASKPWDRDHEENVRFSVWDRAIDKTLYEGNSFKDAMKIFKS